MSLFSSPKLAHLFLPETSISQQTLIVGASLNSSGDTLLAAGKRRSVVEFGAEMLTAREDHGCRRAAE